MLGQATPGSNFPWAWAFIIQLRHFTTASMLVASEKKQYLEENKKDGRVTNLVAAVVTSADVHPLLIPPQSACFPGPPPLCVLDLRKTGLLQFFLASVV